MDYLALINDNLYDIEDENGNEQEDWTCVTGWDRKFGKQWAMYLRSPEFKAFKQVLEKRCEFDTIYSEGVGRGAKTYLHPQLAIHYSMWLSPEFGEWATRVLQRYIEGDTTLAEEIVERNIEITGTTKDAEWLNKRIEGKIARKTFNDTLQTRGATQHTFMQTSKDTNKFIIGMSAKEIKLQRGVKHTRDGFTTQELIKVAFTELVSAERIEQVNAFGHKELSYQHNRTCRDVATLLDN